MVQGGGEGQALGAVVAPEVQHAVCGWRFEGVGWVLCLAGIGWMWAMS